MKKATVTTTPNALALTNGRVILPDQVINDVAVIIEGTCVRGLAAPGDLGSDMERIDVEGRYISPGLIDIHTHGALDRAFNDNTEVAFATITEANLHHGVTAILATVAAAPIADLVQGLELTRMWISSPRPGAQVLGMHIESPYLHPAQRGAQDPDSLRTPDDGSVDELLEHQDILKIFAFAPELPGALELTRKLDRLGIVPAAGHSCATDEQLLAAMRVGLRHITHIWSGQSMTIREGPWRKPGLVEASLVFDELTVEMIADNKHLPATLMKLAYKCIGPDRLCAISDATNGAGLPEGARFRMGAMEYEVHDGVGMMLDRSAFAGSTTFINQMVRILTDVVGIPLPKAIRMLTLTPARVIGIDATKGSIESGKDADLVVFEEDFTPWRCMIGGQWRYNSASVVPV